MRKIAAQYVYPLNSISPISKGVLTLDDNGTILEIGQLTHETASTEFYNGILVPGFVNSHCHIELSHLKDEFKKGTGMSGFIKQIIALRESVDPVKRERAMQMELDLMYRSGVSAMADISNSTESFNPKRKSPLYTRTFLEFFGTEPERATEIVSVAKSLEIKLKESALDGGITPHSCYSMSPSLLENILKEALTSGWISYHNQESWEEEQLIQKGRGPLVNQYRERGLSTPPPFGKPSLLYFLHQLEKAGFKGDERLLLVHNTFTTAECVDAATEMVKNLYWAICPLSNIFINNALPPLELLRNKGVTITIGTDSLSSNSTLSITEEMKCISEYFPNVPLQEMLEWSSYNGAKFLGKEHELGSFEVGKRPGVVLIDNIDFEKMRLTKESNSLRLA
ncbi:amidohydrolase family protein [Bacteroidota bacterium]